MATAQHARAPARPGPGRPPTDARDRILDGAFEVLARDGYAGLTLAKVAAASDQNKALIGYHFGSKNGLVAAVAHRVRDDMVREIVGGLDEPGTVSELVAGLLAGALRMMDADEGTARIYFDLASQSVADSEVRAIIRELKDDLRAVLGELLRATDDGPRPRDLDAAAIHIIAGLEGLALERLERGETAELRRAREMFVGSVPAALAR